MIIIILIIVILLTIILVIIHVQSFTTPCMKYLALSISSKLYLVYPLHAASSSSLISPQSSDRSQTNFLLIQARDFLHQKLVDPSQEVAGIG